VDHEQRFRSVLESVFGPPGLTLSDADGPHSHPEWDSVTHLNLILALEAEFEVRFATAEIPTLNSVGKLRARLERGG
jgi:acyl carrier protein